MSFQTLRYRSLVSADLQPPHRRVGAIERLRLYWGVPLLSAESLTMALGHARLTGQDMSAKFMSASPLNHLEADEAKAG